MSLTAAGCGSGQWVQGSIWLDGGSDTSAAGGLKPPQWSQTGESLGPGLGGWAGLGLKQTDTLLHWGQAFGAGSGQCRGKHCGQASLARPLGRQQPEENGAGQESGAALGLRTLGLR